MEYVLGVDGSNIYTRYFLFTPEGRFVDYILDTGCSQEMVGFDGATGILSARIRQLLTRNRIALHQIAGAGFGLAGVDSAKQQKQFESFFEGIGIRQVRVTNDAFLGLICGTSRGVGVCSLHSAGCATGGINHEGRWQQVGGLGEITGDDGGGGFMAQEALRKVYESFFRCGEETLMTPAVFAQLGISEADDLQDALIEAQDTDTVSFIRIVFAAAELGDAAALDILRHIAHELACSAAGCIRYLGFEGTVEVVQAGGIWRKAENNLLNEMFEKELRALSPNPVQLIVLKVPVAAGAVMLGMLQMGLDPYSGALRESVCAGVSAAIANDDEQFNR